MKIKKNLKSVMIMIMVALSGWYLVSCGGDDDGIDKKELVNNGGENNGEGNNNGDNNGDNNGGGTVDVPHELLGAWKCVTYMNVPQNDIIYVFNADGTGKILDGVNTSNNTAQRESTFDYTYDHQNSTLTIHYNLSETIGIFALAFPADKKMTLTEIFDGIPSVNYVYSFNRYDGSLPTVDGNGEGGGNEGQAPSTPTSITARVDGSSISISWQSVTGATSYRIYRSSSPYGTYSMIGTAYSASYRDNTPISGYNYYKVSAVNNYGESQQSSYAECNYTENIEPTTLSAPTNVRVANEGNNYIPDVIVRWDAVSGAKTYKVYKSSSANGSYSLMEEVEAYYHACTDPNPPTSGSRYYKVKAVNGSVESPYSNYAVYTPVNKDEAFAPSFTWGSCTVSGTNMTLRWTYDTGNQIGKPTKVTLRIYNPYAEEWQNTELSTSATSTTFNFSTKMDNDGWVKAGIIAENAAGSAIHLKVYNYYSKMWSGY